MAKDIDIGGRLHSVATEHIVAGANEIQDDTLNKTQAKINEEVNNTLEIHGSVIEGLNSQNYVSVEAYSELPELGSVNTVYRVGSWDGEQVDTTKYTEYAWINTGIDQGEYVLLDVKNYGIDDEPIAGSNNLVKSRGVSQFLTQNFIEGKGTTASTTKITGLISGHQYRIYLKEYNWGEDIQVAEGFILFDVSNSYNDVSTRLVARYKRDQSKEYYDFVIPNDSDYINITARYNNSQKLHFNIVELNTFTKALRTSSEINSTVDTGTYICIPSEDGGFSGSYVLNVYKDGNTIYQTQLTGNVLRKRTSSDNGTTWSNWSLGLFEDSNNGRLFTGTNISESVINSYKETGIYWDEGGILIVRRVNSTVIYQWRIYNSVSSAEPLFNYRSSSDNGETWSDWTTSIVGFSGDFRYEDINNITKTGFYRANAVTSNYGFALLYVRKNNTNITQVIISVSLFNVFSIKIRQSTDNGNTWGDWEDYLQNIQDEIDIINPKLEALNTLEQEIVNIQELDKINAAIDANGVWKPTAPNVAGKSSAILCTQITTKLKITFALNSSLSFLTELPQSFDTSVAAVFVAGETGRRTYAQGTYIIDIPYGTKYIIIPRETSTGTDISPLEVILYNNNILITTQKQVGLKGQIITEDNTIYLENMSNVIPVSDPLSAFASGESNVYHEPETGLVYFTCIEGFDHPYEAYDCVSLYVFSLTNPNRVERFQIAKATDKGVSRCYTPNLVTLSYTNGQGTVVNTKKVRVFYTFMNENGTDGAYLYYKDFDFNTKTFGTEYKVKMASDSSDLTAAKVLDYTTTQGGTVTGKNFVYLEKITEIATDGYRYGIMLCGESINFKPVVVRSNDNFTTIEFVSLTNFNIRYDCAIGVLGSKLYFVYRVAGNEYASTSGTALCTADIVSGQITNWSTPIKFAEGDSRPDCYTYKDKVYMMAGNYHSVQGRPMRVSSSVWEGTSDNPEDYKKVVVVSDTRGVQNPRVFRYGCGDYGILMQNSPARVDYPNRESTGQLQWQFKTAVCFVCSRIN